MEDGSSALDAALEPRRSRALPATASELSHVSLQSLRARVMTPLKQLVGPRATVELRCLVRGFDRPKWGNPRRTTPFSSQFGFERGTPVDRYYLHRFFD